MDQGIEMSEFYKWSHLWWVEAVLGILVLGLIQYGIKRIVKAFHKKEERGKGSWSNKLGQIIHPPVTLLLWVIGLAYVIEVIAKKFGFTVSVDYLHSLRKAVIIGVVVWVFLRWKNAFQKNVLSEGYRRFDITTVLVIGRLATVAVLILAALIILQIFGLDTAPLLAFGSIGAASLGFAAKDVMANFCSGLILHMTRLFEIGHQVYLPEKNLEGIVEEIGWFRTVIRDKDKRAVYLPNNFISTMLIINISRMSHRHFKQIIKIPFSDFLKIPDLVRKIRAAVVAHSEIDKTVQLNVHFHHIGEYSCDIEVEAYSLETDLDKFNALQEKMLLEMHHILKEAGVPVAINSLTLLTSDLK